jgi:hypothetical protein
VQVPAGRSPVRPDGDAFHAQATQVGDGREAGQRGLQARSPSRWGTAVL